jgi:hypothetical protein
MKTPYKKINKCYPHPRTPSKGEEECKNALELIYGKPFIHTRPCEFHGLELDLFNRKLGIACEYHGKQHYIFPSRFIKRKKNFVEQIRRDLLKRAICERLGIILIVVPYTVTINEIRGYIEKTLVEALMPDRETEWEEIKV